MHPYIEYNPQAEEITRFQKNYKGNDVVQWTTSSWAIGENPNSTCRLKIFVKRDGKDKDPRWIVIRSRLAAFLKEFFHGSQDMSGDTHATKCFYELSFLTDHAMTCNKIIHKFLKWGIEQGTVAQKEVCETFNEYLPTRFKQVDYTRNETNLLKWDHQGARDMGCYSSIEWNSKIQRFEVTFNAHGLTIYCGYFEPKLFGGKQKRSELVRGLDLSPAELIQMETTSHTEDISKRHSDILGVDFTSWVCNYIQIKEGDTIIYDSEQAPKDKAAAEEAARIAEEERRAAEEAARKAEEERRAAEQAAAEEAARKEAEERLAAEKAAAEEAAQIAEEERLAAENNLRRIALEQRLAEEKAAAEAIAEERRQQEFEAATEKAKNDKAAEKEARRLFNEMKTKKAQQVALEKLKTKQRAIVSELVRFTKEAETVDALRNGTIYMFVTSVNVISTKLQYWNNEVQEKQVNTLIDNQAKLQKLCVTCKQHAEKHGIAVAL